MARREESTGWTVPEGKTHNWKEEGTWSMEAKRLNDMSARQRRAFLSQQRNALRTLPVGKPAIDARRRFQARNELLQLETAADSSRAMLKRKLRVAEAARLCGAPSRGLT